MPECLQQNIPKDAYPITFLYIVLFTKTHKSWYTSYEFGSFLASFKYQTDVPPAKITYIL